MIRLFEMFGLLPLLFTMFSIQFLLRRYHIKSADKFDVQRTHILGLDGLALLVVSVELSTVFWELSGIGNSENFASWNYHLSLIVSFATYFTALWIHSGFQTVCGGSWISWYGVNSVRRFFVGIVAVTLLELFSSIIFPVSPTLPDCSNVYSCGFTFGFGSPHRGLGLVSLLVFLEVFFIVGTLASGFVVLRSGSN